MTSEVLEIEVGNDSNDNLLFAPIQRRVRGRFDYLRVNEQKARALVDNFPQGIPGQRLRLNVNAKEGELIEPLREEAHAVTGERVRALHGALPPHEKFKDAHVPTWLYWMKRAVESGNAKLVHGKFPAVIPGQPQLNFLFNAGQAEASDTKAALEAQTAAFNRMAESNEKLASAILAALSKK
jgi:hypothetical protein